MPLTISQLEILEALLELWRNKCKPVKAEEISSVLGQSAGTIRNRMQSLKAMGYVKGLIGPYGGYVPTELAHKELDIPIATKPKSVPIYKNGKRLKDLHVQKITLARLSHPNGFRAVVAMLGDTRKLSVGDSIVIGPTPLDNLIVRGEVIGRDDRRRLILLNLKSIKSIPRGRVGDIQKRELISAEPSTPLKKCAETLLRHRIKGMPVVKEGLVGIVTIAEIVRAISKGVDIEELRVEDVMVKEVATISEESSIVDCIKKMEELDVGRLVVVRGKRPVGVITRTDILERLLY